jgi:hypothetical protein
VEKRAVAGSKNAELRFTIVTQAATLDALCDEAYGDGRYDATEPDLKARRVLSEGKDVRVTYEQIAPAVVSPRDYVLRTTVTRSPKRCEVRFDTTTEGAPPLQAGWVRIEKLWGVWQFEQLEGGVRVVHTTFSDPAGAIPSFLVEGGRRDAGLTWVKRTIARAHAAGEAGAAR